MSDLPSDQPRTALVAMCGGVRFAVTRSGEGFILTIGTFSIALSRAAAEELMCFLSDALEPDDPVVGPSAGRN